MRSAKTVAFALAISALSISSACTVDEPSRNSTKPPATSSKTADGDATLPLARGLDFIEVGPFPESFRAQVASPGWVVGISNNEKSAEVRGPDGAEVLHTYTAPAGYEVADVLLDEPHLVIVTKKQDGSAHDEVVVLDINTFQERRLAKGAPRPAQGSWAAGAGKLAYGSDHDGEYCLAVVDLGTLNGELQECVPPRNGITQVGLSPYGLGYQTFDDHRPASCGNARVQANGKNPRSVVPETACAPWEAVLVDNEAAVWSEVPDKEAVEFARFYARIGDGKTQSLGEGTTGSLVWCGEAAWFINQSDQQLLRWTPSDGLQLAHQAPASTATDVNLIGAPSCSNGSVSFPASLHNNGKTSEEVIIRASLN